MNFKERVADTRCLINNFGNWLEMERLLTGNFNIGRVTVARRFEIGDTKIIKPSDELEGLINQGDIRRTIGTSKDPIGTEYDVGVYGKDNKLIDSWTLIKRKQVKDF